MESTAAGLTSPVVRGPGTATLTRTARVSVSAGRITATSRPEGGGTRLTTAVREDVLPASPVLRARDTVRLTRTVPSLAGPAVETISVSTLSISPSLSTRTTRPGLGSAPQTTAATDTAILSTDSATTARWGVATTPTV